MMNDTIKSIMERYSCRSYTGAPLTDGQVKILAEAAIAAPSASNRQPWRILVINDKGLIDEMDAEGMRLLSEQEDKAAYERMMSRGGKLLYNAPCIVMVAASDDSAGVALDCGIAAQNVCLAAYSLGLGSVMVGMARVPLNGPKGESFLKRMQFPEGFTFGMGILVGATEADGKPHELDKGKITYL